MSKCTLYFVTEGVLSNMSKDSICGYYRLTQQDRPWSIENPYTTITPSSHIGSMIDRREIKGKQQAPMSTKDLHQATARAVVDDPLFGMVLKFSSLNASYQSDFSSSTEANNAPFFRRCLRTTHLLSRCNLLHEQLRTRLLNQSACSLLQLPYRQLEPTNRPWQKNF